MSSSVNGSASTLKKRNQNLPVLFTHFASLILRYTDPSAAAKFLKEREC